MSSEIVRLIDKAVDEGDKKICYAFYNDSLFYKGYCLLKEANTDDVKLLLDIIIIMSELNMKYLTQLLSLEGIILDANLGKTEDTNLLKKLEELVKKTK